MLPAPSARRARAAGEQGHKRFTRYYTSIDTLPAQTARRARAAGELGHMRSYGLAVSILARLSPLSPCSSMWFWRSLSCCSSCSRCSRLACNARRSSVSRASRSMIARFIFGAKKHGIYSVLATFGEKRVLRLSSWLGWTPGGRPGAILEASGALRDRFREVFWMIFGCFLEFFCMHIGIPFLMHFRAVFSKGFSWFSCFFRSARKRPTSEICNTLRVKTNISQGARLRRRSGEGEEKQKKQHKTTSTNIEKCLFFHTFLVPAGLAARMLPT